MFQFREYSVEELQTDARQVINNYLNFYFSDLYDETTDSWGDYETSFGRFFSRRGETGYKRAIALDGEIKKLTEASITSIKDAIFQIVYKSGDGVLLKNLVTRVFIKLFENKKKLDNEIALCKSLLSAEGGGKIPVTNSRVYLLVLERVFKADLPYEMGDVCEAAIPGATTRITHKQDGL